MSAQDNDAMPTVMVVEDNEPSRDVYAVTRPALDATTAVRTVLAALEASARRRPSS